VASASKPSFVIAAASKDQNFAQALRQALIDRGVNAALYDVAEADAKDVQVLLLCSANSLLDSSLTAFLDGYLWRQGTARLSVIGLESERPLLPLALRAERRSNGKFWRLPPPKTWGALYRDQDSLTRMADEIVRQSAKQTLADWILALPTGLAHRPVMASLSVISAGLLTLNVWQADRLSAVEEQAEEATLFASRVLTDITEHLPSAAREATLIRLADDLSATYLAGDLSQVSDAELGRRARLFHLIGEARSAHSDPQGARTAFEAAFGHTEMLLARQPGNPDRMFDHAQSAFWVGSQAYRDGQVDQVANYWGLYGELANRLVARDPSNFTYQAEAGYAALNLGVVDLETGQLEIAISRFENALDIFQAGPLQTGAVAIADVSNTLAWLADAHLESGALQAALETRTRSLGLYETQLREQPGNTHVQSHAAHAQQELAVLLVSTGQVDQGADLLDQALTMMDRLYRETPNNDRFALRYVSLVYDRAKLALMRDEQIRAQLLIGEAKRLADRANANGELDTYTSHQAYAALLDSQLTLSAGMYERALLAAMQAQDAAQTSLANGREASRGLLIRALMLQGQAHEALGQHGDSRRLYRSAQSQFELVGEGRSLNQQALYAELAWRLGEASQAQDLRESLIAQGYAHPDFLTFWRDVDRANSVSSANTQGG